MIRGHLENSPKVSMALQLGSEFETSRFAVSGSVYLRFRAAAVTDRSMLNLTARRLLGTTRGRRKHWQLDRRTSWHGK